MQPINKERVFRIGAQIFKWQYGNTLLRHIGNDFDPSSGLFACRGVPKQFLRGMRIPEFRRVKIHNPELHPMLDFDFPKLVQERLPETILCKIVGYAC